MSMFLPEGFGQTQQPQDGVASITPASPETTSEDIALMQRVLSAAMRNPNLIPADFMSYIVDYIQTSRLIIPIGQVFGFSQFTAQDAPTITASETTTASSYADLATVGPTLSGLSNGKYVIFFGCRQSTSNPSFGAAMSIQVNSTAPTLTTDDLTTLSTALSPGAYALIKTLSNNNINSLTAKYYTGGGATAMFANRWMIALKFANL